MINSQALSIRVKLLLLAYLLFALSGLCTPDLRAVNWRKFQLNYLTI